MLIGHWDIHWMLKDKQSAFNAIDLVEVIMEMFCKVYKDDENRFYSDGVERVFGSNCTVETSQCETIFVCVMPLKCDPEECGLKLAGLLRMK